MSDKADRMQQVIAALLSKTVDNGCTEAEAASAMEKAQEILLRYNLSQAEVLARADGDETLRQKVGVQDIEVARGFKWRAGLLAAIAHANLCTVVISDHGDRGAVHVFGKQENVRVVLDMWEWISSQLERLGFQSLRDYMQPPQQGGWNFNPDGSVTTRPWHPKGNEDEALYLAGFYKGAITRIEARLTTALRRFTQESEQTRDLVLVNGNELSATVHRVYPRLGTWRGLGRGGRDGMADGLRAGDRVKLTRDAAIGAAGGANLRLGASR